MNADIKKKITDDGTIDNDYTWGRPVTTYLSPHQHLRLLAMKGRLEAAGVLHRLRAEAS
jgi:hypothetical protein